MNNVASVPINDGTLQNETHDMSLRAEELEREIAILRKNNEDFTAMRRLQDQERARLAQERKEMELHFNAEHSRLEEAIHSERCRLAKERSALELKLREGRPGGDLSEELRNVQDELATLKRELDEQCKNEADAVQASQQRISRLEEELQKMRQSAQQYELTIAKLEASNVYRPNYNIDLFYCTDYES